LAGTLKEMGYVCVPVEFGSASRVIESRLHTFLEFLPTGVMMALQYLVFI
jgi:hypothetical protein